MDETQIKQIIERQPLHGTALLDPRCKILLLVCIGFVSYFLAGEVVSLALMLVYGLFIATVYKGNIIKNLIMDCQSYTKYRPNETTGGIFVSWRRKEELPTGA